MVDFFKPSRHLQLRRFGEVHPPGAIDLIAHCHYFRLIDEPHGEILYVAGLSTSAGTQPRPVRRTSTGRPSMPGRANGRWPRSSPPLPPEELR